MEELAPLDLRLGLDGEHGFAVGAGEGEVHGLGLLYEGRDDPGGVRVLQALAGLLVHGIHVEEEDRVADGRGVGQDVDPVAQHLCEQEEPLLRRRVEVAGGQATGLFQVGSQALRQIGRVQLFDVLPVQEPELRLVEHGRGLVDPVQGEGAGDFGQVQHLFPAFVRPAQEGQSVDHGLGQEAPLPEGVERHVAVAFGELAAVRAQDHGKVGEVRRVEAEGLVEDDLLGRVGEVVFPADHVGDLHQRVVDDHREVVGGRPVGPGQDPVPEGVSVNGHVPPHPVREGYGVGLDFEADGGAATLGLFLSALGGREVAARPGVDVGAPGRPRRFAVPVELFLRAVAGVGPVLVEETLDVRPVQAIALGLPVGSRVPSDLRAFVPVEPQPPEVAEDRCNASLGRPGGIRILEAKHERPALPAGEKPVEEGRAHVAEVKVAGG